MGDATLFSDTFTHTHVQNRKSGDFVFIGLPEFGRVFICCYLSGQEKKHSRSTTGAQLDGQRPGLAHGSM